MQFYILTLLQLIGVTAFSVHLIQTYSQHDVSLNVKLLVLSSWVMNFAIIILVPLDIYFTLKQPFE